jgi:hypothetical protein
MARFIIELDHRIAELQGMRATLASLAAPCHGDTHPNCPFLDDVGALPAAQ